MRVLQCLQIVQVRHWYVPDNVYLMKIKICLQQNSASDSCKSTALKAVVMSVQPCCAHVLSWGLQSHVVPCWRGTASWKSQSEAALGVNQGGAVGGAQVDVSCWLVCKWVKRGVNCRVKMMSECSSCSVCKAVLYLGTNLYITCLQTVVLGEPLKSLNSIHQFSLPHLWMMDLKSLWLVKYEHSAVSELLSQLLLREFRSRCLKMHKLDLSFNSLNWKVGDRG